MNHAFLTRSLLAKIMAAPYQAVRFVFHLPRLITLIHRLMTDRRVPIHAKAVPFLAIVYIISPLDLLKEFLFGPIGYVDDIVVTYYLLRTFIKMCPEEVVAEHVAALSLPPSTPGSRSGRQGKGAG